VQRVRELKSFGILVEQDDGRFSAKDVPPRSRPEERGPGADPDVRNPAIMP